LLVAFFCHPALPAAMQKETCSHPKTHAWQAQLHACQQ
jgi:hypothetical protein